MKPFEQSETIVEWREFRGGGEGVFREEEEGAFGCCNSREQEPGGGFRAGIGGCFRIPEGGVCGIVQLDMRGAEFDFGANQAQGVRHEGEIHCIKSQLSGQQQGWSRLAVKSGWFACGFLFEDLMSLEKSREDSAKSRGGGDPGAIQFDFRPRENGWNRPISRLQSIQRGENRRGEIRIAFCEESGGDRFYCR